MGITDPEKQFSSEIVAYLTQKLRDTDPTVKLSATKWTSKGNLLLTAHHSTSQASLTAATHNITSLFQETQAATFDHNLPHIKARANVKWSKILIHRVPLGINSDPDHPRGAYTPEECHTSLITDNPQSASLKVTQKNLAGLSPPHNMKKVTARLS